MKTITAASLALIALSLMGCAGQQGNYYFQTPKLSSTIGKTGYSIYGYAVIGLTQDQPTPTSK